MLQLLAKRILCVLPPSQNYINYSEQVLRTLCLTTYNKRQHRDPILAAALVSNTCIHFPWCSAVIESFGCLYFVYCAWVGFSSSKAWEDILHTCGFLYAIQHALWYVCTLLVIKIAHRECIAHTEDQISLPKTWLACNLWVAHKTSQAVLLAHA